MQAIAWPTQAGAANRGTKERQHPVLLFGIRFLNRPDHPMFTQPPAAPASRQRAFGFYRWKTGAFGGFELQVLA